MKKIQILVLLLFTVHAYAEEKTVKVFLLAGQSNMLGLGHTSKLPAPYKQTRRSIRAFHESKWQLFAPGMMHKSKDRFGPEVSFAQALEQALPGEDIRLVKYAVGGTLCTAAGSRGRVRCARFLLKPSFPANSLPTNKGIYRCIEDIF